MKKYLEKALYFKNHFLLLAIRGLGIISLFISFRLINVKFGEELFGLFSVLVVFAQIGNLIGSFGLPVFLMKELSKLPIKDRISENSHALLGSSAVIVLVNSVLYIIILFICYLFSGNLFPESVTFFSLLCILVSVPFMAQSNLHAQVLRANNGTKEFQLLNGTLPFFLLSIFLALIYHLDCSSDTVFGLYLLSHFLTHITSFLMCKIKGMKFYLKGSLKNYFSINKNSFDYFSTQFITQAFNWTTVLVTSYLISELDTGGINVIIKYLSLSALMIMVTNTYQGPNYTNLFHSNKLIELNKQISINTKFMVLITMPLIIIMFSFPDWFLGVFSENYKHLAEVFRIMLLGSIISLLCGSVGMLMQMTHQQKAYRNIMASALLFHIFLSILLTSVYGVTGLGISMTIVLIYWNVMSAIRLKDKHGIISYLKL